WDWCEAQRTVTGAGSGCTTVGCIPGTLAGAGARVGGPAFGPGIGGAEAGVVDGGGEPPGSTTTRVPTLTRSNRSETSSFSMPMQPDETNLPIVEGWLVPWMRYTVEPRYIARAPSGLPGPPAMKRGRYGWRLIISAGGCQARHSALLVTVCVPAQVNPSRPTPTP